MQIWHRPMNAVTRWSKNNFPCIDFIHFLFSLYFFNSLLPRLLKLWNQVIQICQTTWPTWAVIKKYSFKVLTCSVLHEYSKEMKWLTTFCSSALQNAVSTRAQHSAAYTCMVPGRQTTPKHAMITDKPTLFNHWAKLQYPPGNHHASHF